MTRKFKGRGRSLAAPLMMRSEFRPQNCRLLPELIIETWCVQFEVGSGWRLHRFARHYDSESSGSPEQSGLLE